MSRDLKQFIIKILASVAILIIFGWIVFSFIVPGKYLPVLPWMLAFFTLITILTYGYQLRLAKKDMARFTRTSMLVSILRLALYSFFTIIYIAYHKENAAVFVVSIILVYMVFTFLDIANLSKVLKRSEDGRNSRR